MENAFEIIVIILSATLFMFLVFSIIAIAYLLKLVKTLQTIADRGEILVSKVESIGDSIRQNVSAVGILRIISNAVRSISKFKRR